MVVVVRPGASGTYEAPSVHLLPDPRRARRLRLPRPTRFWKVETVVFMMGGGSRIATLGSRVAVPAKRADAIYSSREWRALVRAIKAERGRWCERCGSAHRVAGDHIVEIKDGGAALDAANVELLCQPCHNRKTAAARARRVGLA
jgi:5-methylcytosine-specific restriction enzyme A